MTVTQHDDAAGVVGGDGDAATLEDLYGLAPDQFTPARNALAKRLRAAGDKVTAAEIAKVRKPPVTAWALNQVARQEPALIDDLMRRGVELREAMDQALHGDASAVREAQQHERAAVDAVVEAGARHLDGQGHRATEQNRQRMAQTLRAAFVDGDAAGRLRAGVLDRDLDAAGFGMGGLTGFAPSAARPSTSSSASTSASPPASASTSLAASTSSSSSGSTSPSTSPSTSRRSDAEPAPDAASEAAAPVPPAPDPALERALEQATERLQGQEAEASRAAQELQHRIDELDEVQSELDELQRRLDSARAAAQDAEGEATRAQAHLEDTRRQRDEAEAAVQADRARPR